MKHKPTDNSNYVLDYHSYNESLQNCSCLYQIAVDKITFAHIVMDGETDKVNYTTNIKFILLN